MNATLILDAATVFFLAIGIFFTVVGAIGLVRFPDFYTRLHAAGLTDTLGAEMITFGLAFQAAKMEDWTGLAKLFVVGLFLFLTSPTATHALANAAFTAGLRPKGAPQEDLDAVGFDEDPHAGGMDR